MERQRAEEAEADYEAIRRDWMLGSEAFRRVNSEHLLDLIYGPRTLNAQLARHGEPFPARPGSVNSEHPTCTCTCTLLTASSTEKTPGPANSKRANCVENVLSNLLKCRSV